MSGDMRTIEFEAYKSLFQSGLFKAVLSEAVLSEADLFKAVLQKEHCGVYLSISMR